MKHLIIEARESGTSTGRYVDKLVESLQVLKPGFDITVLTKPSRLKFFERIAPGFKSFSSSAKEFSLSEQATLAPQLYSLRADLVHFTVAQQPVLYFGKAITTVHDLTTARFTNPSKNPLVFKFKQLIYRFVVLWSAHKSKAVITPSEFVKQDLARFAHINPAKIKVIHEAADKIAEVPQPVKAVGESDFIMYVGRPLPHKNLGRLIEAFELLQKDYPELRLILAGKKDVLYERIEKKVGDAGIKNVIFTGFVTEGQLRWLYEQASAYVFPSLSEGFGLPGLEAMAHGAPVVSSDATCLPEIYGDAAHYFDPKDPADMATKISEVLASSALRDQLITKGRLQAAKYSWRRMAEQTLEVYKQVLGV